LKEIEAHNDRTTAIVASATLEYALQLAIEARYPTSNKLFGGLLRDFSRKIEFATAMDVIDQEASDHLDTLRRIRNEFSHDMNPLSFASEEILPLCEKLPVPDFLDGPATLPEPEDTNARMRRRFTQETYHLLLLLIGDLESDAR
jgi:hypothetical protein